MVSKTRASKFSPKFELQYLCYRYKNEFISWIQRQYGGCFSDWCYKKNIKIYYFVVTCIFQNFTAHHLKVSGLWHVWCSFLVIPITRALKWYSFSFENVRKYDSFLRQIVQWSILCHFIYSHTKCYRLNKHNRILIWSIFRDTMKDGYHV